VRIARAQDPTATTQIPAARETPAVEPQVNNSTQTAPAPAAPAENNAEQVAPQDVNTAPPAAEAAPAPVAPEQAAEPAPVQ
jgi:hypothetical protein